MRSATASAPAKIILLGEHAVVYGEPALATPIDRMLEATVFLDAGSGAPPGAEPLDAEAFSGALRAFEVRSAHVRVRSAIPPSVGLGSSAAVAAAVLRALGKATGREFSAEELWRHATAAERRHHGASSGLDPAAVLASGPVLYRRGDPPTVELVRPKGEWALVVAVVSPRGPTRETVQALAERHRRDPTRYGRLFREVGELALAGRAALVRGDAAGFGELMNLNQGLLNALGLSSPEIEAFCHGARRAGALGAKLTGAGGGGAAIALAAEPERLGSALAPLAGAWFVARPGGAS